MVCLGKMNCLPKKSMCTSSSSSSGAAVVGAITADDDNNSIGNNGSQNTSFHSANQSFVSLWSPEFGMDGSFASLPDATESVAVVVDEDEDEVEVEDEDEDGVDNDDVRGAKSHVMVGADEKDGERTRVGSGKRTGGIDTEKGVAAEERQRRKRRDGSRGSGELHRERLGEGRRGTSKERGQGQGQGQGRRADPSRTKYEGARNVVQYLPSRDGFVHANGQTPVASVSRGVETCGGGSRGIDPPECGLEYRTPKHRNTDPRRDADRRRRRQHHHHRHHHHIALPESGNSRAYSGDGVSIAVDALDEYYDDNDDDETNDDHGKIVAAAAAAARSTASTACSTLSCSLSTSYYTAASRADSHNGHKVVLGGDHGQEMFLLLTAQKLDLDDMDTHLRGMEEDLASWNQEYERTRSLDGSFSLDLDDETSSVGSDLDGEQDEEDIDLDDDRVEMEVLLVESREDLEDMEERLDWMERDLMNCSKEFDGLFGVTRPITPHSNKASRSHSIGSIGTARANRRRHSVLLQKELELKERELESKDRTIRELRLVLAATQKDMKILKVQTKIREKQCKRLSKAYQGFIKKLVEKTAMEESKAPKTNNALDFVAGRNGALIERIKAESTKEVKAILDRIPPLTGEKLTKACPKNAIYGQQVPTLIPPDPPEEDEEEDCDKSMLSESGSSLASSSMASSSLASSSMASSLPTFSLAPSSSMNSSMHLDDCDDSISVPCFIDGPKEQHPGTLSWDGEEEEASMLSDNASEKGKEKRKSKIRSKLSRMLSRKKILPPLKEEDTYEGQNVNSVIKKFSPPRRKSSAARSELLSIAQTEHPRLSLIEDSSLGEGEEELRLRLKEKDSELQKLTDAYRSQSNDLQRAQEAAAKASAQANNVTQTHRSEIWDVHEQYTRLIKEMHEIHKKESDSLCRKVMKKNRRLDQQSEKGRGGLDDFSQSSFSTRCGSSSKTRESSIKTYRRRSGISEKKRPQKIVLDKNIMSIQGINVVTTPMIRCRESNDCLRGGLCTPCDDSTVISDTKLSLDVTHEKMTCTSTSSHRRREKSKCKAPCCIPVSTCAGHSDGGEMPFVAIVSP